LIERIKKLTINFDNFEIYPVVAKYPQGYDEILVPTLVGKKFPYGYSAANIGVIVLNIQAVMHVFEAVTEGKPLIERTLALCGPAFKQALHLRVRVGAPLDFVLAGRLISPPARVVLNSLLTGFELKDLSLPVDRTFSQLIAVSEKTERQFMAFLRAGASSDSHSNTFVSDFLMTRKTLDTNCHGEERPCIQCGYCLEVCPVKIIPTLLDRYQKLSINETLMRYGIFNCIDCNLCSYVCPSKIPLAANIKEAKAKLIDSGCDHSLCILPKFDLIGLEEYKGVKVTR
jgi:Na(+)-translocating NADH:ubiquinone oxidoreductase A subunit